MNDSRSHKSPHHHLQDADQEIGPLSKGKVHAQGVVAHLDTQDLREIQKLMAIGILPGVDIRLLRKSPSYVFQVGYSRHRGVSRKMRSLSRPWCGTGHQLPDRGFRRRYQRANRRQGSRRHSRHRRR